MEPGKGNRIPESGGILLVESGAQLKESRIRDCLGFHYMGRDKFVSPLIVTNDNIKEKQVSLNLKIQIKAQVMTKFHLEC